MAIPLKDLIANPGLLPPAVGQRCRYCNVPLQRTITGKHRIETRMSATGKKIAGTFIQDSVPTATILRWLQQECRTGSLSGYVRRFVDEQDEPLDHSLVLVEAVTEHGLSCRIPCRMGDHESARIFDVDVRFLLDPTTGETLRAVV